MNYIGSKFSLLKFIDESISAVVGNEKITTFCDLFAGTGVVGSLFKKKGCKIIANDLQYYSYVLNKHYIGNHYEMDFISLYDIVPNIQKIKEQKARYTLICDYLSSLDGVKGFVYDNYCPTERNLEKRQYYTSENGMLCDAIRQRIEQWHRDSKITDNEYFFLLASLLESVDKCANTASVYGAFLKEYKKSALKRLSLSPLPVLVNDVNHEVFNEDSNELIKRIKPDILYLDPPYNARQYSSNYHVLETIARYDNPTIKGKTGLRDWSTQKSDYCQKNKVKEAFKELMQNAHAKYIFLSYNNEGLMSHEEIKDIMSKRGKYGIFTQEYNRFKADSGREYLANKTIEYLHYVVVNK